MLLYARSAGSSTERLTPESADKLRESDRIQYYEECGWQCAAGWKGESLHVAVHAHSREEISRMVHPERHMRELKGWR